MSRDGPVGPPPARGIVLFAHGARDAQWAEPFRHIRTRLVAALPGVSVELAFLEIMTPALADSVASLVSSGAREILLVPLFMAQGGHLKKDLPVLLDDLRVCHPAVSIRVTPAIGEVEELLAAITAWIVAVHATSAESSF